MNEQQVLQWLYADIDELIDFKGYRIKEVLGNERKQSIKISDDNGGSICDDGG